MTAPLHSGSRAPPRAVIFIAAAALALAAWLLSRSYTSSGTREFLSLYHSARTAADTARIDTTFTPGNRSRAEPHSCGFLRTSARWR